VEELEERYPGALVELVEECDQGSWEEVHPTNCRVKYITECVNQGGGWRFQVYSAAADAGTEAVPARKRN
jgi:hypothetical protein